MPYEESQLRILQTTSQTSKDLSMNIERLSQLRILQTTSQTESSYLTIQPV